MSIRSCLFNIWYGEKRISSNLFSLEKKNSQPHNCSTIYCTVYRSIYNILWYITCLPRRWSGSNDIIYDYHIQGLKIWKNCVTYCCQSIYTFVAKTVNGQNITESITENKEKQTYCQICYSIKIEWQNKGDRSQD